jgi:hypothetical protein
MRSNSYRIRPRLNLMTGSIATPEGERLVRSNRVGSSYRARCSLQPSGRCNRETPPCAIPYRFHWNRGERHSQSQKHGADEYQRSAEPPTIPLRNPDKGLRIELRPTSSIRASGANKLRTALSAALARGSA